MRLLLALTLIALLAPAVATAGKPTPSFIYAPQSIDFGTVTQGAVASQDLTITNTGKTMINIGGWGVTGGPFTFSGDMSRCVLVYHGGRGAFLTPGRTCTIVVIAQTYSFPPGGIYYYPPGTYVGAFTMRDTDDVEIVRVPLTVTVTP